MAQESARPKGYDYEAIGWLLTKVSKAGLAVPSRYFPVQGDAASFDAARKARMKLGYHGISKAFTWYNLDPEMRDGTSERRRLNRIAGMRRRVEGLRGELSKDDLLNIRLSARIPFDPKMGMGFHAVMLSLEALHEALLEEERNADPDPQGLLPGDKRTRQSSLLFRLLKVFEEGFDTVQQGNVKRTWDAPSGAFVTFLQCAYQLQGKPRQKGPALYKALQRAGIIKSIASDE